MGNGSGRPRILGVFAHPDDEVFCAGGTLARYTAAGAEAMVVSFTRGDAGQIRDASTATRTTPADVRHVDVSWYPAGSYIIEQGERATSLYLIISGQAEVIEETADGQRRLLARRGPGEFVGELGIAYGVPRMANVIAVDSVTCLVFSFAEPMAFDGRGPEAALGRAGLPAADRYTRGATTRIDVSDHIDQKVAAIAAHRSQYPVAPDMFPAAMLQEMFSAEYFTRVLPTPEPETDLLSS